MNTSSTTAAIGVQLRFAASWLPWAVALTTVGHAGIAIGFAVSGTLDSSWWESVGWVLPWLALAAGITNATCLPVLVAHGLSRRTAAVASAVLALGLAATGAVIMLLGLSIESAAFRAAGLAHVIDDPHLFHEVGQPHLILVEYLLLLSAFNASGWLTAVGFYRLGGRLGMLTIPVAALPALGAAVAVAGGWIGERAANGPAWIGHLDQPVALALIPVAAGLAAMPALARTVPVPAKHP